MDALQKWTSTKSKPGVLARYQYIIVLITILVIVMIVEKRNILTVNLKGINWKGLISYFAVIVIGYFAFTALYKRVDDVYKPNLDNLWDFFHFTFYFGLGYFFPNNWLIVAIFMVCWELIEDYVGYNLGKTFYIETNGKKMFDMVCNSLGYWLGSSFFVNRRPTMDLDNVVKPAFSFEDLLNKLGLPTKAKCSK